MGPGSVDEVGPDGFADGVPAVGDVGLGDGFGVVGEERVVAPDREQRVLGVGVRTRRTTSRAVICVRVPANAVYSTSATCASEISSPVSGSSTAPG